MPLYEYRCEACSHQFTLLQPVGGGAAPAVCPECGLNQSRRLYSAFATRPERAGVDPAARGGGGCGAGGCGCH